VIKRLSCFKYSFAKCLSCDSDSQLGCFASKLANHLLRWFI